MSEKPQKHRDTDEETVPPTPRAFWRGVLAGTGFSVLSFWAIFYGAVAISGDRAPGPMALGGVVAPGGRFNADPMAWVGFGIGLVLMPVAFFVMARMTTTPFRLRSVFNATLLGIGVWLWLPIVTGEPLTPTVAAFGAGGVLVLGYRTARRVSYRVVAVLFVAVYVFLFFSIIPAAALLLGPLAPLPAIGWADRIAARRSEVIAERDAARGKPTKKGEPESGGRRSRRKGEAGRRAAPQRRGRSGVKRRR